MEKKAPDAVEMAAQANEKREKAEKTAQGWIKRYYLISFIKIGDFDSAK